MLGFSKRHRDIIRRLERIESKLGELESASERLREIRELIDAQRRHILALNASLDRKFPEITGNFLQTTTAKNRELSRKFLGERCILVGTGPSLNEVDLSMLENQYIFCANGGVHLLDGAMSRIFAYCLADPLAYVEFASRIDLNRIEYLFFCSSLFATDETLIQAAHILDVYDRPKMHEGGFQFDITRPLFASHTVMHVALQIAVYMGFSKIGLIGIDLDFSAEEPHFYSSSARELAASRGRSINNQDRMRAGFEMANRQLSARGVKLVNLGTTERLDFIEKQDFSEFLA